MSSSSHPVEVRFGRGRVAELEDLIEPPALVVTGRRTLERAGLAERVAAGGRMIAHAGVPPNATPAAIDAGAARAVEVGARSIVGLGGGSAMDAAKSIAVMTGHADALEAVLAAVAAGEALERRVRLVQVPTTAGTGSEVTRWASIWSEEGAKRSLDVAAGYADVALVDPALTDTMGPRLTAATGLDAAAHAMESLWSVHANPTSDDLATRALRGIREHLLPCVTASAPVAAHRDGMSRAALDAGLALSGTRTAAAHALSYAMTGRFGLDHGLAVGLLCRALLPVNARAVPGRVDLVLRALAVDDVAGAQAYLDEVLAAAGMAPSLASFGIPREAHRAIVDTARAADRLANNPGELSEDDLLAVLDSIA